MGRKRGKRSEDFFALENLTSRTLALGFGVFTYQRLLTACDILDFGWKRKERKREGEERRRRGRGRWVTFKKTTTLISELKRESRP